MAFVGLVTQKDKPTGVSLMAKIVTANKKKSIKKQFKVSVKPNALDDLSCCVIDHGTVVDKLNNLQDMNNITEDVILSYNGINGTSISYRIIDIEAPLLSKYLSEDGKLIKRPLYGEGDAIGYIEITVSKGQEKATSRIRATISSVTAIEVLADPVFTTNSLWTSIRNGNTLYDYRQGIYTSLNLIKTQSVPSKSKEPVTIAWSVEDLTLPYASSLYTEPRIDITDGSLYRPTYKEACSLVGTIPNVAVEIAGSDLVSTQNRVRIGGLNLTAHLTLGSVTQSVTLQCSTISKYLTNEEIMDVVLANIYLETPERQRIYYKTADGSKYEDIKAPADGGIYRLTAFGNTGSELFESPELKLKIGDISGVTLNNMVLDFNGTNDYPDASLYATAFNTGFKYEEGKSETYAVLDINIDALKDVDESKKKFACGIEVTVNGYSATGETLGGVARTVRRFAQFKIDTSTMTTAS